MHKIIKSKITMRTNKLFRLASLAVLASFPLLAGCFPEGSVEAPVDPSIEATGTWNILREPYQQAFWFDGLLLEWEYFMIHDQQGRFTGSLGYVLADPKVRLNGLMPSGANAAIAGKMQGVEPHLVDFVNFPFSEVNLSSTERRLRGERADGSLFADIQPVWDNGVPSFHLTGMSEHLAWDLHVSQDWAERNVLRDRGAFAPAFDPNISNNPSEEWLVNMVWPRTRVVGTITDRASDTTVEIDGHGYRENSYGRYAFLFDGWDFGVISDEAAGVQWTWQSYHQSRVMDFVDVSFYDAGELVGMQLRAVDGELGWQHDSWYFDEEANQCTPLDATVVAQNDDYRIEVTMDNTLQVPMLSEVTMMTELYVINVLMPVYSGKIIRLVDGETVVEFSGQGGGEFALPRSNRPLSVEQCQSQGRRYSHPLP